MDVEKVFGLLHTFFNQEAERRSDVEDLQLLLAREDIDQEEAARQFEANGLSELYQAIVKRLQR